MEQPTPKRRGLTWWDFGAGLLLAVPFVGVTYWSSHTLNAMGLGDMWSISRTGIRLYCLSIIGAGLALAGIAAPLIIADLPDSARLRGWSLFLIGAAYALTGGMMSWYLLARRNYEHPTFEPFRALWLLAAAWIILIGCSMYALRLERKAASRVSAAPDPARAESSPETEKEDKS